MTTQPESSQNTGLTFTENATSDSVEATTFSELMSSAEDSLAKTFPTPDAGQVLLESDQGCSLKPFAWFDNSDPEQLCWRTWQRSILGGWMSYSERWPESGMVVNGIAYRLPPLAPRTCEKECSFLPTPTLVSCEHPGRMKIKEHQQTCISFELSKRDAWEAGGQWSPSHAQWFMGFPASWTALEDSETP